MSWKHGNPGCPCCDCIATTELTCVCNCWPTPRFPRTATFADSQGPHTLTTLMDSGAVVWSGGHNWVRPDVYRLVLGFCDLTPLPWVVSYSLEAICPGNALFPDGAWRLNVSAPIRVCSGVKRKALSSDTGTLVYAARMVADWTCDPDAILSFTHPTDLIRIAGDTYPNPFAGEVVDVTFG